MCVEWGCTRSAQACTQDMHRLCTGWTTQCYDHIVGCVDSLIQNHATCPHCSPVMPGKFPVWGLDEVLVCLRANVEWEQLLVPDWPSKRLTRHCGGWYYALAHNTFILLIKVTNFCTLDTPLAISSSLWWISCWDLESKRALLREGNDTSESSRLSSRVRSMLALPGSVVCPVSFLYNSQDVANTVRVDFQNPSHEVLSFPRSG